MNRTAELLAQGWTKQTTYDQPRLSEMVQMYQELGYLVHLEPFVPAEADSCSECMSAQPELYKTIYTRKEITRQG